jgi:hypothetical protein
VSGAARLALVGLVVALAGCGSGDDEKKSGPFKPFSEVPQPSAAERAGTARAAPRWEMVTTLRGSGPATRPFTIARTAIQWRARWQCKAGRLALSAITPSGTRALSDASCPRRDEDVGFRTGPLKLGVKASGPWQAIIEQQVDTALHEPPLPAMRAPRGRVLASGGFYGIERTGRGKAMLYSLPKGRLALRLAAGFATSANTDLFVWLSTTAKPRTTVQAAKAKLISIAPLKSTLGEQNYLLPAKLKAKDIRSVVIWCEPVQIAYTAAALRRG